MTDFEKWWRQQTEWGFNPEIEHFSDRPEIITISTWAKGSENFRGYGGFVLSADFDLEGNLIQAGVWE